MKIFSRQTRGFLVFWPLEVQHCCTDLSTISTQQPNLLGLEVLLRAMQTHGDAWRNFNFAHKSRLVED